MVNGNGAGESAREEARAAALAARDSVRQWGCGPWLIIGIVGFLAMQTCSSSDDRPQLKPVAAPVVRAAAPADKPAAIAEWIGAVEAGGRQCEVAVEAVSKALRTGADPYRGYALADQAEAACDRAQGAIATVAVPRWFGEKAAATAAEVPDACSTAMFQREVVARKIKALLDGGMKPSAMREAELAVSDMNQAGMRCAALPIKAALDEGVALEDVSRAIARRAK